MAEKEQPGPAPGKKPVPKKAWIPPFPKARVTLAIKALAAGTADRDQQRAALDWIINDLCKTYDWAFHPGPDGQRETDVALGRQLVGKTIVGEINLPGSLLKTRGEDNG